DNPLALLDEIAQAPLRTTGSGERDSLARQQSLALVVPLLAVADVLDRSHESGSVSRLILQGGAGDGGVEFRPVLANEAGFQIRQCLGSMEPFCESTRLALVGLEDGNGTPRDLVGFPSKDAFECRIAALDGLIPAEQGNADWRRIQNRLQLGSGPPQFHRPVRHLRFELAARATKALLDPGALKCRCGVVRSHRNQELVDLGGKVGPTTRRGDQTALGVDTDGNDETPASLRPVANFGNDLLARQPAEDGEVPLQPFGKPLPCVSPRQFDCGTTRGIAQAD